MGVSARFLGVLQDGLSWLDSARQLLLMGVFIERFDMLLAMQYHPRECHESKLLAWQLCAYPPLRHPFIAEADVKEYAHQREKRKRVLEKFKQQSDAYKAFNASRPRHLRDPASEPMTPDPNSTDGMKAWDLKFAQWKQSINRWTGERGG